MDFMDAAQWVALLGLAGLVGLLFWITSKQIDKIDRLRNHVHGGDDDPAD